jgi:hypothetical protein
MTTKPNAPIALTPEQREQIRQATDQQTPVLQLRLDAPEARLAPGTGLD